MALLIKEITGFQGDLMFNESKPDGTPRKLMDVSRLSAMGWQYTVHLKDGLKKAYNFFQQEIVAVNS